MEKDVCNYDYYIKIQPLTFLNLTSAHGDHFCRSILSSLLANHMDPGLVPLLDNLSKYRLLFSTGLIKPSEGIGTQKLKVHHRIYTRANQ